MSLPGLSDAGLLTEAVGVSPTVVSRVPTSDGAGVGTIAAAGLLQVVKVTSAGANDIVVLPPPVPGTIVILLGQNTTGYEVRTTSPTTIGINGGTGSAAESAIPASSTVIMICETATAWKGLQSHGTGGTLSLVEVAAP